MAQEYSSEQVAQMKALLAKQFDPEDRSPEAKGQRFLKRLLEYGAQAAGAKRSRSATSAALRNAGTCPKPAIKASTTTSRTRATGSFPVLTRPYRRVGQNRQQLAFCFRLHDLCLCVENGAGDGESNGFSCSAIRIARSRSFLDFLS